MDSGTVLYEATSFRFDSIWLIPLFILIFGLFFPQILKASMKFRGEKINETALKVISIVIRCIVSTVFVIMLILPISAYYQTIVAYRNGDYSTVEGYVEDYHPMPYEGHSRESFTINGVEFVYSDFEYSQGYNNTASHGGVITHNGQHLRLRYIPNGYSGQNVIVYIEELP